MSRFIFGWGINDVDYKIHKTEKVNGKQKRVWICPYYADWKDMIRRCFDPNYQTYCPTYIGCTVSEDWKYLSNFIKWVDSQPNRDWQKCALDKDFLVEGNTYYSQDTCVYIPKSLNSFTNSKSKCRGNFMIGVSRNIDNNTNPYQAHCCNPSTGKNENIGSYPTELAAHKAWQAKKHEYACMLADMQEDPRVADALRQRYAPDKDLTRK